MSDLPKMLPSAEERSLSVQALRDAFRDGALAERRARLLVTTGGSVKQLVDAAVLAEREAALQTFTRMNEALARVTDERDAALRLLDEARAEQTRFEASDKERLAQISSQPWQEREHLAHVDRAFLLRLLKKARIAIQTQNGVVLSGTRKLIEARAEIARLRDNPGCKILDHKWLDPECVETGCQSLKLRVPPEADVMELAAIAYGFVTMPNPVALFPRQVEIIEGVARALTAYGDQRARAARAVAIEEAAQDDKALERAAKAYLQSVTDRAQSENRPRSVEEQGVRYEDLRAAIRALAAAPPQSERPRRQLPFPHRFDGGSFGGGDQGECAKCGLDARDHDDPNPSRSEPTPIT